MENEILLSFYGDDFTGSTDSMECLSLNGVPAVLFLAPPTPEEVRSFRLKKSWGAAGRSIRAFGVAGVSRSMHVSTMDRELPSIIEPIRRVPAEFFHYKVCSTFDSSPTIGSIGHAVDLMVRHFPSSYIPLLIAAPFLNRFSVFGNLFARVDGVTWRLDRHPTMSRHPVTPMNESDLRVHLSRQTDRRAHLFDLFALESGYPDQEKLLDSLNTGRGEFILFDTYDYEHLLAVGRLMYEKRGPAPQFLVGSSGIEYALARYLQTLGRAEAPPAPPSPGRAGQMVIMAGSAAPTTRKQLEWIFEKGVQGVRIDTAALVDPRRKEAEKERVRREALSVLGRGGSAALYTALGPEDPAIAETRKVMERLGLVESGAIARAQGELLREILERSGRMRVVVAGGDTSGHVSRELGITALEVLMPIAPGAPLCLAHSTNPQIDGMEICLKGGQNGRSRFFESILEGRAVE